MAFSKAKLLRFNEVTTVTPSPADYTILNKAHVTGAALSKSERFIELSSPASSDASSHHSSVCNLPVFRTPNPPPPRKPKTKNINSLKPVDLFQSEDSLDALKEKIVECNNKDQYINELMEQVDEMKHQLNDFNNQLSELSVENSKLTETLINSNTDKELLLNNQQKYLTDANEKLIAVYNTHNKIDDVKPKNGENINDLKTLSENIGILDDLLESYKMINDRNVNKLQERDQQLLDLEKEYLNLQQEHTAKVAQIQQEYETQIKGIHLKHGERESNLQRELQLKNLQMEETENRLKKLQEDFKLEKQTLLAEGAAKVQQLTGNFKEAHTLAEIQFEQKCQDIEANWKIKSDMAKHEADAILKECQAIAEYNIIQSEIEKNQIVFDFNETKKCLQESEDNYAKLKCDFNQLNKEYSNLSAYIATMEKTQLELEQSKNILTKMNKDKHTYEVTVAKAYVLIETLKNRLMDSDKDVEQLKCELEDTEASKVECEVKCNKLEDELQTVLKLFEDVSKDIKAARKDNEEKARQVEKELHLKVDHFKNLADAKIAKLNLELNETKSKLDDALQHLEEHQSLNTKAQEIIQNSLRDIDELKVCATCTENEEKYNSVQQTLQELQEENQNLHQKIAEQESLIGPFREQLTAYEAEHKALTNEMHNAEQEAKEMGIKYAQLLGHQNQKQKIKHLVDLKRKNQELSENVKKLETQIRQQTRTIEKLKKELSTTTKNNKKKLLEDKENIVNNSLNQTLK